MNDLQLTKQYQSKAASAKQRGITFNLSFSKYKKLRATTRCYFTGVPLDGDNFSLDRVDNSIGYTDKNTVACDKDFNSRKSNLSVADIRALYFGLLKKWIV